MIDAMFTGMIIAIIGMAIGVLLYRQSKKGWREGEKDEREAQHSNEHYASTPLTYSRESLSFNHTINGCNNQ